MKKYLILLLLAVGGIGNSELVAQNNSDTSRAYYTRLLQSKNPADRQLLTTALYDLLKSDREEDWMTAQYFFGQMKKPQLVDSVLKANRMKFPTGKATRDFEARKIAETKGAKAREAAYKQWVKKFPPEKYPTDQSRFDYARSLVARSYAEENNPKKVLNYLNMMKTALWKVESSLFIANEFTKYGRYKEAKNLLAESIDYSYKYKTIWKDSANAKIVAAGYVTYLSTYSKVLYENKEYQEALAYQQKAYDELNSSKSLMMNAMFAKIYIALGRDSDAFEKIDALIKAGQATPELKETMEVLYKKVKGENGFTEYMAEVQRAMAEGIREELKKKIINQSAPAFTLTNFEGKPISLEDLKGKIVVVDFWATWCGPCKASFPAMQMAVNKYKNDKDVVFVFVHTWEREDAKTATVNAEKFIKDNNYSFNVLMDLKNPATGKCKVVTDYGVTGIPTKFIIDKNGSIRFKFVGFSGGNDFAVEEIAVMIEMAKNG